MDDLVERLRKASGCFLCNCRDCERGGMGELHDHVCTQGPDCKLNVTKLSQVNSGLRILCGQSATEIARLRSKITRTVKHPVTGQPQLTLSDDMFLQDVKTELAKACSKFPGPNPTIAALAEEAGELSQAMLHIREGKSNDWWAVWNEAVQVAVMAARAATEGDETLGVVPKAENCQ